MKSKPGVTRGGEFIIRARGIQGVGRRNEPRQMGKGKGGNQKDKVRQPPEASMDKILPGDEIARKKRTWETNSRFASGSART